MTDDDSPNNDRHLNAGMANNSQLNVDMPNDRQINACMSNNGRLNQSMPKNSQPIADMPNNGRLNRNMPNSRQNTILEYFRPKKALSTGFNSELNSNEDCQIIYERKENVFNEIDECQNFVDKYRKKVDSNYPFGIM